MKTFLVLYMATKEQQLKWREGSPEDQQKGMDEWMSWANQHEAAWVDIGNPVGANFQIDQNGHQAKQNEVCGYSLLRSEDQEAAAAIFEGSPHLKKDNTWVEVMEVVEMG